MRTLQIAASPLAAGRLWVAAPINNQVLLERDLRMQEDKIYELEAMLDDAARPAKPRSARTRRSRTSSGGDRAPAAIIARRPTAAPAAAPPRSRPEAPKLELPKVDVPELEGGPAPLDAPGVETTPGKTDEAIVEGQPTQLVINTRLTGGLDRDGRHGDEGVLVAFEPRDGAGPAGQGARRGLGRACSIRRWKARPAAWPAGTSTPTKCPAISTTPRSAAACNSNCPGPAKPPKHQNLRLFVRYTTPDGKKITADTPIDVRGPSSVAEFERQGEAWSNGSQSESAERPARPAEPKSRLKQRGASGRDRTAAVDDRDSDADDDEADPQPREPIRQATRPDRPTWKPYR